MSANFRNYIVFDFETDSPDPSIANPVEIAGVVIHARKMEIIPNTVFHSYIRPLGIDSEDYLDEHRDTILWHASLPHNKCTPEEMVAKWKSYPETELTWLSFLDYINRQNFGNKGWTAPIPVGANIGGFDLPIMDRFNAKYKKKNPWWMRDSQCILKNTFLWTESLGQAPTNYKMDTLREFYGINNNNSDNGAHTAIQDVLDEAEIFIKQMNLHRACVDRIEFFRKKK